MQTFHRTAHEVRALRQFEKAMFFLFARDSLCATVLEAKLNLCISLYRGLTLFSTIK